MGETLLGWSVGDTLERSDLPPVTRIQFIKYAGASGDYNPIHTVDAAAEEAGLPGVIAHGMLTAAMMGSLFSAYSEHGFVKELWVRFSESVYVGDELHLRGLVTGIQCFEKGCSFTFEVYAHKASGEKVASGTALFQTCKAKA